MTAPDGLDEEVERQACERWFDTQYVSDTYGVNVEHVYAAWLAAKRHARLQAEKELESLDSFHDDPIEDIAHALAHELEIAELDKNALVTVNRKKLLAIAARVMEKAKRHADDHGGDVCKSD